MAHGNDDGHIGTWALVRGTCVLDDGSPGPLPYGGDGVIGRVVLGADGRMAAVICQNDASIPTGGTREYTSYCGRYTFDGARLVTRVDAASDPARLGTDQVRDVRFEDGLMVLRPPPRVVDGRTQHRELYWRKIADT